MYITNGTRRADGSIGAIIEYPFFTWEKRRGIAEDRHRSSKSSFLLEGGHETEMVPMRCCASDTKRRPSGAFLLFFITIFIGNYIQPNPFQNITKRFCKQVSN